ncbi:hypothetical protein K7432_008297 [Basidiobolus ranarum]|uniref:Uncharacterized protein n=1 Tax=Basidiobolus ranarum TaxID=34480 RepID=A0ABR2WRZ5_9FUNG
MQTRKNQSDLGDTAPPSYHSLYPEENKKVSTSNDKTDNDPIATVIATVNRMGVHFPRYQDQCASLSENQKTKMSAAALAKDVDRLSRGQYSNQRAIHSSQGLLQRISKFSQQGASQRFTMTEYQEKNLELARLGKLVNKMERSRLDDQDWKCQSQVCEAEIEELVTTLRVPENAPLNLQRYTLSGHQKRDMFIRELLGRVCRLEGSRMSNQDAEPRNVRREREFTDHSRSHDRLPSAMDEQRAIYAKGRFRQAFMKS